MYKDILVHLDGGARDPVRVDTAITLGQRFGARITGLFARLERQGIAAVARRASDAFEAACAQAEQDFTARLGQSGLSFRWWRLSHGESGHVLGETAVCARFHDLTILGQHHDGKDAPEDLGEAVITQSGRPVLFVPAVGDYPTLGDNVMIAWNGGREAARAVRDALPLLRDARVVEVVSVRGAEERGPDQGVPPLGIVDHLGQHGVAVIREVLAGEEVGAMDLLLSRAFDQGADLLVMGGHGGYHLPFLKGAGTRHILRHMTLPVLMSN